MDGFLVGRSPLLGKILLEGSEMDGIVVRHITEILGGNHAFGIKDAAEESAKTQRRVSVVFHLD